MIAVLGVIPVCLFLVVFIISLIGFCKGNHKKKDNELPITISAARKRASVLENKTYHQDGGHGLATYSNGAGDGGAAVMTGVAALAAATALDGGAYGAGDGGGGGGGGGGC